MTTSVKPDAADAMLVNLLLTLNQQIFLTGFNYKS